MSRNHWLLMLLLLAGTGRVRAGEAEVQTGPRSNEPATVMLLGVFHFDNPGLDAVKFDTIDVMTAPSQRYLEELTERLAQFKPTKVLLEYNPDNEAAVNQRYRDYRAGSYALERNEIYQLGFRVAAKAGLARVYSFDDRSTNWDSSLWDYLPKHEPQMMQAVEKLIADMSRQFQQDHQTQSLRELLRSTNDAETDRANKDTYLLTNAAGAEQKLFHGANSTASWWHRNFKMYANIQLQAAPGERILVIGGQGHTAILRDLLQIDPRLNEDDPAPYL